MKLHQFLFISSLVIRNTQKKENKIAHIEKPTLESRFTRQPRQYKPLSTSLITSVLMRV